LAKQDAGYFLNLNKGYFMEQIELKNKILTAINELPFEKLKLALNFLKDLQCSNEEETQFLLKDPEFKKEYLQAKKEIRQGKTVKWKDIKRNV